jgi:hypothetical protein
MHAPATRERFVKFLQPASVAYQHKLNLFFFGKVQAGLQFLQPGSNPGVKSLPACHRVHEDHHLTQRSLCDCNKLEKETHFTSNKQQTVAPHILPHRTSKLQISRYFFYGAALHCRSATSQSLSNPLIAHLLSCALLNHYSCCHKLSFVLQPALVNQQRLVGLLYKYQPAVFQLN